jgi:hypothetical protein
MNTYKIRLDYESENGEFLSEDQFTGTLDECNEFMRNFRQLKTNEVGIVIIQITE